VTSTPDAISDRLVRLPMWLGLEEHQHRVCEAVVAAVRQPDLAA
jgi:hypothetical protein